jgi:hypothetical protein
MVSLVLGWEFYWRLDWVGLGLPLAKEGEGEGVGGCEGECVFDELSASNGVVCLAVCLPQVPLGAAIGSVGRGSLSIQSLCTRTVRSGAHGAGPTGTKLSY